MFPCLSILPRSHKRRTACSGLSWASCETYRAHTRLKRQLATNKMGLLQNLKSCCVYKLLSSKRRPSNGSSMAAVLASVSGCGRALIEPCPIMWVQMWHERTTATMVLHGYADEILAVACSRHATTRKLQKQPIAASVELCSIQGQYADSVPCLPNPWNLLYAPPKSQSRLTLTAFQPNLQSIKSG